MNSCRRVDNRYNVFEGAWRNPWFIGVQAITLAGQIAITFKGHDAFQTEPLSGAQWGWTIFFGAITIPIGAAIRTVPDSFVLSIGHKLKPLSLPVRFIVRYFRKRKNKGLTGVEAKVAHAIIPEDEEEPDEERRIRRFRWKWLRPARKSRPAFSFPIAPPRRRGTALAGLVAASLASAGFNMEKQKQRSATGQSPDVGAGEAGEFDVVRAIDEAKEQPGNRRSGFEVHPDTSKDDPVLFMVVSKGVPPSQDLELRRQMGL